MGERTHNHLCEDLAKLSGTFERGGANLKGERAFRPTHASATCAYPRDALSELSLPRPLAQVMGRLGKDVRAMFELFSSSALRLALAGPVRACARSRTALPVPCMGPGLTAGLGRSSRTARAAARAGLPTHYRLLMRHAHVHASNLTCAALTICVVAVRRQGATLRPQRRHHQRRLHCRCNGFAACSCRK